jgi:hypothetical protein
VNHDSEASNMDPIDRELLADDDAHPAPQFTARVMAAVRREAATPPPLPFPWQRLALGLAACALWLLLGYRAVRGGDPAEVLALARSWQLLLGVGLLLGLASLRLARFCTRS